jgi:DNA-binding response OmpR family regulator
VFSHTSARYTPKMATPSQPLPPRQVSILVLDNDPAGASALRQILDSEGWRVRVIPDDKLLLTELRSAEWSLLIANISQIPVGGPVFSILRELAAVSPEEGGRLRVLYLVPSMTGSQYVHALEAAHLPYVVRPYHLHDFLEKVSDLLVEVKAIEVALRQVRHEFGGLRKKKKEAGRTNSMFAARDSYSSYTEEELAEYERSESEASKTKRRGPNTNLGGNRR